MRKDGYTLIEAAVAMLLTAIMAASMFSVALSTKRGSGKGMRKLAADQAARQLAEQLKNYVTANWGTNTINGLISGPGGDSGTAGGQWSMTNANNTAQSPNGVIDDCANTTYLPPTVPATVGHCYAFTAGSHTLTGFMPSWFEGSPYFARIEYWVDPNSYVVAGGSTPLVSISVLWQETQ